MNLKNHTTAEINQKTTKKLFKQMGVVDTRYWKKLYLR
jgi:hypothetical protein